MQGSQNEAIQIERINAMITGLCEYYKTAICSRTFNYIDNRVYKTALSTFKAKFEGKYKEHEIPLQRLSNRPGRHAGYKTKTFAIKNGEQYIGITKAFITHSHWEKYPFNQQINPFSSEGRHLYLKQSKKKSLPMDRPPLYDIETLTHCKDSNLDNFEYLMNREYAYNRDKGKCKICGEQLIKGDRHCHRIDQNLPLNQINRVPNLAWICWICDDAVHGKSKIKSSDSKIIKKINKYQLKLH